MVLGRLRRRILHSLSDVDAAFGELMAELKEKQSLRRLGVIPTLAEGDSGGIPESGMI